MQLADMSEMPRARWWQRQRQPMRQLRRPKLDAMRLPVRCACAQPQPPLPTSAAKEQFQTFPACCVIMCSSDALVAHGTWNCCHFICIHAVSTFVYIVTNQHQHQYLSLPFTCLHLCSRCAARLEADALAALHDDAATLRQRAAVERGVHQVPWRSPRLVARTNAAMQFIFA